MLAKRAKKEQAVAEKRNGGNADKARTADEAITAEQAKKADDAVTAANGASAVAAVKAKSDSKASSAPPASSTVPAPVVLPVSLGGHARKMAAGMKSGVQGMWASAGGALKATVIMSVVGAIGWGIKVTIEYPFTQMLHRQNRQSYSQMAPPAAASTNAGATVAPGSTVPVPKVTWSYAPGHKIRLDWTDLGPGFKYRLLCADNPANPSYDVIGIQPVDTAGALVNLNAIVHGDHPYLAVRAIAPNYAESARSNPVQAELNESNDLDAVWPLPVTPTAVSSSELQVQSTAALAPNHQSAPPKTRNLKRALARALAAPTGLSGEMQPDNRILLKWQSVPGATGTTSTRPVPRTRPGRRKIRRRSRNRKSSGSAIRESMISISCLRRSMVRGTKALIPKNFTRT